MQLISAWIESRHLIDRRLQTGLLLLAEPWGPTNASLLKQTLLQPVRSAQTDEGVCTFEKQPIVTGTSIITRQLHQKTKGWALSTLISPFPIK